MNFVSISFLGLVTFAAIALFYHHHVFRWVTNTVSRQLVLGGLFGLGTVLLMLHSRELTSGLLLDARVLLIGYAGLLAGWRGAAVSLLLAVAARFMIGGQGMLVGSLTLTLAVLIGLGWRYFIGRITLPAAWHYLGFGAALSLTLVTITLFPEPYAQIAFSAIPVLTAVNIIGSVFAGYMELGIEETAKYQARLQQQATTDELTGLDNRLSLKQYLAEYQAELQAHSHSFALISLDIDNFRHINSTLGHKVGDRLLISIAQNLRQVVRPDEKLARVEADEFVVLVRAQSVTEVMTRAEQLLEVVRAPHHVDDYVIMTTASGGVVWATDNGDDSRVLLQNAEIAMYQAKSQGRNHCTIFAETMRIDLERKSALNHALQQALTDGNGLRIVLQPQISLVDGRLTGAEVLLRWRHPQYGDVSPAEFIPIAENSGLIRMLDSLVFTLAAQQLAEWQRAGFDVHLSINISVLSLIVNGCADDLIAIFNRHAIPCNRIAIEVTESHDLQKSAEALLNIQRLKEAGCAIELDDFGTGHSSLVYLQQLPLTGLKIDQGFVRNLDQDGGKSRSIVRATIAMAKAINLELIAEGVETESQLSWLQTQGCDIAQGYLLDKPMDAEAFYNKYQSYGSAADSKV